MLTTEHKARTAPGGKQVTWAVPESFDIEPLISDLSEGFTVQAEQKGQASRQWYDTDDWRLYRKNLLLFHEGDRYHLVQKDSGKLLASLSGDDCNRCRFAWDFPVSRIRSLLSPALSIRAVLPMLSQEISAACFRVLNRDRKTVAMIYFDEHLTPETGVIYRSLTVKGVRGYNSDFQKLCHFFTVYGISDETRYSAALDHGVRSLGRRPEDYTSKFSIELKKEMPSVQAMVLVYRQLLETMEHNVQGILDDLDTEFLHDFRVAIRRTRSGIGQVKGVLPAKIVQQAKEDFSWLGSITGPTRDLDVYLLERDQYMSRLPDDLRPFLDYFFTDIADRREDARQKLVQEIRSTKCRQILETWHDFLHGDQTFKTTEKSDEPIGRLAREIIFGKYTKILKKGAAIKRSTPDEELHRLRIQCKKLRYILEFFTSLFPAARMKVAIKQLKRLQDNLGSFNDLSVQQEMLQEYLAGLRPGSRRNQQLATAIGGLLATLHNEQQQVRKSFYSRFARFSSEENRQLYTKLFK